jgi:hypothetical protein
MRWALALFVLASTAQAQQFWKGTRAGMTPTEVAIAIGKISVAKGKAKAKAPDVDPSSLTERYELCGEKFSVEFEFDEGKLSRIVMSSGNHLNGGDYVTTCVIRELTSVYGKPLSDERRERDHRATFSRADTRVNVLAVASTDLVFIIYSKVNGDL